MIKEKSVKYIIVLLTVILYPVSLINAQDTTQSLAFKRNRPLEQQTIFYHPDIAYQMWHQFNLVKEANAGNALAQHELGIRYILGDGVPADTEKAAYWIGKAADNGLPGACYNYGILLNNGWGINWNPFKAFDYFMQAAKNNMPQAEYVIGLTYTDNLVVKRDWGKAYYWINKSSREGFSPALTALSELKKNINLSSVDTTDEQGNNLSDNKSNKVDPSKNGEKKYSSDNPSDKNFSSPNTASNLGLVFIDFNTKRDSSAKVPDKLLLEDLMHQGNEGLVKKININIKNDSLINIDSASVSILKEFADAGSPEALTLIGRLYSVGQFFHKNLIMACVEYLRAAKLDSPRSPLLLWQVTQNNNFYDELKTQVDKNNPRAMFVWYGLFSIGFYNQMVESDAVKLLESAAALKFLPALNELGLDYYTGKYLKQDRDKAISIWEKAAAMGSKEAELRLSIADIYESTNGSNKKLSVGKLKQAIKDGSVLAQATLAYCYEDGIGVSQNIPDAVEYYRFAAQRGSQFAYGRLKEMYDRLRPNTKEFQIN